MSHIVAPVSAPSLTSSALDKVSKPTLAGLAEVPEITPADKATLSGIVAKAAAIGLDADDMRREACKALRSRFAAFFRDAVPAKAAPVAVAGPVALAVDAKPAK